MADKQAPSTNDRITKRLVIARPPGPPRATAARPGDRSRRAGGIWLLVIVWLLPAGGGSAPRLEREGGEFGDWLFPLVQAETINRIVAIVNDEVITEGDVAAHMSALLQEDDPQETGPAQTTQMRQVVLQRLIEERLIIQEAKRTGLTVDLEDVARHLHAIQQRAGTNGAYEQMLHDAGLSEEQLKAKIREQLLVRNVIDHAVRSKLVVSPAELARVAPASSGVPTPSDEVQAYHLLIRVTPERSMEQARALILQLAERLRRGAPFDELAKQYSEDSNAEGGGLMGWVHQGQLLPELDDVLFRLQAGELSEPIQTRLGFHLVKVVARRRVSASEISQAQADHEQQLYQEKFAKAMARWLWELKQRAYIEVLEDVH